MARYDGIFPLTDKPATWRPLAMLLGAGVLSATLYLAVFSWLDRPLSVGVYEGMIAGKADHFRQADPPRLLLLGGSNVRCSHVARVIQDELGIPTTNGGLSADLSPAFYFDVFLPHLAEGDVVYLPLEYEPFVHEGRERYKDMAFFVTFGRDWPNSLSLLERARARFGFDLGDAFASMAEIAASRRGRGPSYSRETNEFGDQIGFTREAAAVHRDFIMGMKVSKLPDADAIRARPYMVRKLEDFLDACRVRGVTVIGGLPTTFEDRALDPVSLEAIREIYTGRGHLFLVLPNRSQYPRDRFFDSHYHLVDTYAEEHSRLLARHLEPAVPGDGRP